MLLAIVFLVVLSCAVAEIVNTDVALSIDASTSVVRLVGEIKATGIDGTYDLAFQTDWANHLSFISVLSKGKELKIGAPVSVNNLTMYTVAVSDSATTIKFQAVFTSLLVPFPAEISQSENQLVKLDGNHYFLSPYPTVTQKSVYKLASTSIESFTKLSPSSVRGSSIHFGPYKEVGPYALSPLHLHFVNNFPFAKISSLVREVEVSHWGNIAIEEIYELQHVGARLKGGFSRFEYQMQRGQNGLPSFKNLIATLPSQANNIYYRDQIGNISTSDIRKGKNGDLELDIQTRFPLFGGWQTQFYVGYSIPTEIALFNDADGIFVLKFDFFTIFRDVWVEDMEIKVILPEGCSNIAVKLPYEAEEARSIRYSYLDSTLNGGRTVVILKAKNLVEEHDRQVVLTYNFPKSKIYVEPIMVVISFFSLFLLSSILHRGSKIVRSD